MTGTAERRSEIMRILIVRRRETVGNLAYELGVSERTIRRDVNILSITEPIYTRSGRYDGGVYLVEGYKGSLAYLKKEESDLLDEIYNNSDKHIPILLDENKMRILYSMKTRLAKPNLNEGERNNEKRRNAVI